MKHKFFLVVFILFSFSILGQTQKEINTQSQTWLSINSVTKFEKKWAFASDVHLRTNDFFQGNNFFLIRGGIAYIPNSKYSFTSGYAHLWLAPRNPNWTTFADEKRIYQQIQMITKQESFSILQRIRNEQRWQEIIINDEETGKNRFSNRVRYLVSLTIPIFKNQKIPALVFSDEVLVQFGKDINLNTFDQNRFFIGIKQKISNQLSFDFGYMKVYQQRASGYQYDNNNTIRLFFYLSSSLAHAE